MTVMCTHDACIHARRTELALRAQRSRDEGLLLRALRLRRVACCRVPSQALVAPDPERIETATAPAVEQRTRRAS